MKFFASVMSTAAAFAAVAGSPAGLASAATMPSYATGQESISGVVSGLVLFYTPFPNCNWNEIDIEHLGNTNSS